MDYMREKVGNFILVVTFFKLIFVIEYTHYLEKYHNLQY